MRKFLAAVIVGGLAFSPAFARATAGKSAQSVSAKPAQSASAKAPAGTPADKADPRAFLDRSCVTCHNQRLKTAGLMFDRMDLARVSSDAPTWEKAVRKLRGGMMPPLGARRPDPAALGTFVSWLEDSLDASAVANPDPGRIGPHRLNRTEYANAVEDLLGIRIDPAGLLPRDDASDGFDNVASVLKVSPSFLEQYIGAARQAAAQAIGQRAPKPASVSFRAPEGVDQSVHLEGLPLGTRGGMLVEHWFPADGEYKLDIKVSGRSGLEYRQRLILTIDGVRVFEREVGGPDDLKAFDQQQAPAASAIEDRFKNVRVKITAGPHRVAATFVARTFSESDNELFSFTPGAGVDRIAKVGGLEITGPFSPTGLSDTPSRRRVLVCTPATEADELPCARRVLSTIARRAFRRPVTDDDLSAPLAFYQTAKAEAGQGAGFDAGIQAGLTAILASPKFLYRVEIDPPSLPAGAVYRISDLNLASRLSFFLWSRLPDDTLLAKAAAGRLHEPRVLEAEVGRMLADPRAASLSTNFAAQWLGVRRLDDTNPDPVLFPGFDEGLRAAFRREMQLFVGSIMHDDRSVVDLLDADYTFVNERLARHYGIPNVLGERFRRVTLADPNRWGLLGKGGVLLVTSYPDRTAPVLRGAWILENLLGTPPSPPPPDVEALLQATPGKALTVRERMEQHRAKPSCRACHGVMDPLGFALENFDAVGEWRDRDRLAGSPIDASGQLADGTPVKSPRDLREALTKHPEPFVQTMTEKLLTYALGRRLEAPDMPAVRAIVRASTRDGYRFSSIVAGIVESAPFQMRKK